MILLHTLLLGILLRGEEVETRCRLFPSVQYRGIFLQAYSTGVTQLAAVFAEETSPQPGRSQAASPAPNPLLCCVNVPHLIWRSRAYLTLQVLRAVGIGGQAAQALVVPTASMLQRMQRLAAEGTKQEGSLWSEAGVPDKTSSQNCPPACLLPRMMTCHDDLRGQAFQGGTAV